MINNLPVSCKSVSGGQVVCVTELAKSVADTGELSDDVGFTWCKVVIKRAFK